MKKYGNEFKVGLFFLICILGLVYLAFGTGKINIKKKGYPIYVEFNEVAGLGKKAPVMLNGLEVGKVDDIKISYENNETKNILTLWLDEGTKVRPNPTVAIKTLGLMGEKFIQITSIKGEGFIGPKTTLKGKTFADMDALMGRAQNIAKEISKLVATTDSLANEVKKIAVNLNYTVEGNQDKISQIVDNFVTTSKNIEEFSEDLKKHPWKLFFKTKEKNKK